jgi:hypothetical protein
LTLEESAESMASSSLEDDQPWDEKEEMLKPIKEAMGLNNSSSSDIQVNASPIIVEMNLNQSRESFGNFYLIIKYFDNILSHFKTISPKGL